MHASGLRRLLILALALGTQPALAFLDPPYLTPANPTSADIVSVNIYGGECDFADGGVIWPPPVARQENELTILLTGGHEEDPELCYFDVGTLTAPIGAYPPGTYTLVVNWRYSTFSGWITETLGVIPFTVSAAPRQPPVEAPTLSGAGLTGLLLALVGIVLRVLRKRVV